MGISLVLIWMKCVHDTIPNLVFAGCIYSMASTPRLSSQLANSDPSESHLASDAGKIQR